MSEIAQTPEKVQQRINAFLDTYPRAGYTFDHLVLGDQNLDYESIEFCLQRERIESWFGASVMDLKREFNNPGDFFYEVGQLIELKDETIKLLKWLHTLPESLLEATEQLYNG
jgi:hypothetical protein